MIWNIGTLCKIQILCFMILGSLSKAVTESAKWLCEISKFKVLTTTWTRKSNCLIFNIIYFNDTSTSPFAVHSVNSKGCKEESVITEYSSLHKCVISSDVLLPLPSLMLKLFILNFVLLHCIADFTSSHLRPLVFSFSSFSFSPGNLVKRIWTSLTCRRGPTSFVWRNQVWF